MAVAQKGQDAIPSYRARLRVRNRSIIQVLRRKECYRRIYGRCYEELQVMAKNADSLIRFVEARVSSLRTHYSTFLKAGHHKSNPIVEAVSQIEVTVRSIEIETCVWLPAGSTRRCEKRRVIEVDLCDVGHG